MLGLWTEIFVDELDQLGEAEFTQIKLLLYLQALYRIHLLIQVG